MNRRRRGSRRIWVRSYLTVPYLNSIEVLFNKLVEGLYYFCLNTTMSNKKRILITVGTTEF